MKRYLFFTVLLFCIPLFSQGIIQIPADFPKLYTTYITSPADGYILMEDLPGQNAGYKPYIIITDNNSNPFFIEKTSTSTIGLTYQPNGLFTYWDLADGIFHSFDDHLKPSRTYSCVGNNITTDNHELRILSNGHVLLLGSLTDTVDMSSIVPGGNTSALVLGLVIQEFDDQNNLIFEWKSRDHFKITDAVSDIDLTAGKIDYVHANALDLDLDGNIILSSRHLDEITKIDRKTGEIIWRLGGKNNQFTFINDTIGFSHQHCVRVLPNGNLTMFDNGNLHTTQVSRACEYKLDQVNKTATLVWQYHNTPEIYTFAMGSVERLPNGNTLIGWGANTTSSVAATEVDPYGNKALEITFPFQGVWSYRALKFTLPSSITDTKKTEQPADFVLKQNYPNPFNPSTTIEYFVPYESRVTLTVYNTIGQKVKELKNDVEPAGSFNVRFDGSQLASGIYFYQLHAQSTDSKHNYSSIRKLILMK